MDEIWEKAVETALEGQTDVASVRSLTLDGVVKCVQGRLPPPSLFEKYHNLLYFSLANIGVSSLEQFPRLQNLQKLTLSDNRIAGGLEFLVQAGLRSLRDLDLSNNRIQDVNDLRPLADLQLVSLDLYECPVTRVKDYRLQVFGLIKSLKYLDKMDAEENERPESDEEEEEDDDDAEEEEDDPGSGEIDGEERPGRLNNGHRGGNEDVVDVDEDESDADEEETETSRGAVNGIRLGDRQQQHHLSNGFRNGEDDEEDTDSGDEIDDEEGEDDDVVEVHEIVDSDEEDGVDEDEDDDEEDEEEVDNEDGGFAGPNTTGRRPSTEGEIDAHEQGEDEDDDDDIGETGEEDQGVDGVELEDEEDEEEEEEDDHGAGYLVQPVGQVEIDGGRGSDMDPENDDEEEDDAVLVAEDEEEDEDDGEVQEVPPPLPCPPPSSSHHHKRKRDDDDDNDDEDGSSGGDDDDGDDVVEVNHVGQPSKNIK